MRTRGLSGGTLSGRTLGGGLLLSVLCVLGLLFATAPTIASGSPRVGPAPQDVTQGRQLKDGGSSYPRAIRLKHSGAANGRILVSVATFIDNAGRGGIYQSSDEGRTFQPLGEIRDPAGENRKGMCCATLFEMPRPVADMPAGTLLWAGTAGVGAKREVRQNTLRLWRSDDHGQTWSFLSNIAVSPKGTGVWEPELSVTADGHLAVFYADEGDHAHHDQKIVQVRSTDGRQWTDYRDTVVQRKWSVRPGMPGIRQLPDGTYVMTYEVCNTDPVFLCGVYLRGSRDGWDYGDPWNVGRLVTTVDGKHPTHTPTVEWAPGPGLGRLILAYQILSNPDGTPAPGDGRTLLVSDIPPTDPIGGRWREIPSPVQIAYSRGSDCRNFSPTVLASEDGRSLLHIATDYTKYVGGVCEAFYGTGPAWR